MSHPDNTFNALKGHLQFVERWQCKFKWHRWAKWGPIIHSSGGIFAEQRRECVDCGKIDVRKIDSQVGR